MKLVHLIATLTLLCTVSEAAVLLGSGASNSALRPARKLVVYPGFNEVEVTKDYKEQLKSLIERVRGLRRRLDAFQQETIRDASSVVQKLEAETDKNALDSMLNKVFLSTQKEISEGSNGKR